MNIVVAEVVVKDLTLNGAGELSQRWKVEASLGVHVSANDHFVMYTREIMNVFVISPRL